MTPQEFALLPKKKQEKLNKQFIKFKKDYFKDKPGFTGTELLTCQTKFLSQVPSTK